MSKFRLLFVINVVLGGAFGVLLPNTSFAASPFLLLHTSVEQTDQTGQGRASFAVNNEKVSDKQENSQQKNTPQSTLQNKAPRKPVTLAESLVYLRQCHMSDQQGAYSTHSNSQYANSGYENSLNQQAEKTNITDHSSNYADKQDADTQATASQSTKIFLAKPR